MTTPMAVYDVDGCGCICGGQNHGAGLNQAIRNTLEHWGQWLDRATEANPSIVAADISRWRRPDG
jgi:hypothetical protein